MKLWLADTEEAVDVADGSDQRTKLSHLTSDRPRAPSRRPPSNYQPTTSTAASVDTVSDWPLSVCLSVAPPWHCWLGRQTCKNSRPYNLYCVGADVKPCSINQSLSVCLSVTMSACSTTTSSESFIHMHGTHNGASLRGEFLADRTANGFPYAIVLRPSVDCLYGMYCG